MAILGGRIILTLSMLIPLTFGQESRLYLQELARFETTKDLEESPAYRSLQAEISGVLSQVWQEELASSAVRNKESIEVVAWNIERGIRVDGIIRLLRAHPELQSADVLLLSEVDWGMARTNNRFITREVAAALGLNYAFAPCYLALTKGAGVEKAANGSNEESLHGNAILSRFPLRAVHSFALPNGKDKMKGAEKRIGCQRAVIADIEHPLGTFRAVCLHLDAHSSQDHRYRQMCGVLDHLQTLSPQLPVLIGGDWNTTTHDTSRALYSILGYFLRVLMGIRSVVSKHYPYPERWFERHLFRELETRGFNYRDLNNPGQCTLHYDVNNIASNLNLGEWLPQWCFWFINWALQRTGGLCSMKLDWFAGQGIKPTAGPLVLQGLREEGSPVSDHDPIALRFLVDAG
jgi:endonuclease/exonuclease/phosphatase family metal-dependent hydrolase